MAKSKSFVYIKYFLMIVAIVFIVIGITRQEHQIVLQKAINICLECIGIG